MAASSSLRVTVDLSKALQDATKALVKQELLVGIPGDSPARPPEPGEPAPPSNALIGYVQEFGDDERNIPARPFLMPGFDNARPDIVKGLEMAGRSVLDGQANGLDKGFTAAGLAAQAAVKKQILTGEFAPLSERTLQARARRLTGKGKASQAETSKAARRELANRAAGELPSSDARPLYDTHSLFNAVTYVVRTKGSD